MVSPDEAPRQVDTIENPLTRVSVFDGFGRNLWISVFFIIERHDLVIETETSVSRKVSLSALVPAHETITGPFTVSMYASSPEPAFGRLQIDRPDLPVIADKHTTAFRVRPPSRLI